MGEVEGTDAIFSQTSNVFMQSPRNFPSGTPETLLHLFGVDGMLDIGDEVTVPSSPLSFHTDSDHSYFSLATPRFDCISESSLPEFHDLFDFHSIQPFDLIQGDSNIDVQEQIIESNQPKESQNNIANSQVWMHQGSDSRESGTESNDLDSSNSSCDSDQEQERVMSMSDGERNKTSKPRFSNHHTGPFPHTFISTPGDRRIRFCFGLQTIIKKIKALMSRTGASANFRADFEGHAFTLENADKLLKFSDRSQKAKGSKKEEACSSDCLSPSSSLGPDDDHRYAATILTQSESSYDVRDHQYNDLGTAEIQGKKHGKKSVQKSFIRTRYARERWLRKGATTIYSKMQRLMNRTGAKMTLTIEYQGLLVTPKNYKELQHLFGQYQPTMKKFNTKIIIEKKNSCNRPNNTFDSLPKNGNATVMKVSFPQSQRGGRLRPSLNVEFLEAAVVKNKGSLQTVVESDHDYESSHSPNLGPSEYPASPASSTSAPELSILPEPHVESFESFAGNEKVDMSPENYAKLVEKTDVATNTEISCEVCGTSEEGKNWIRCANPLCHYLVHPACIGFFVMNLHQLQFLPPYFCPSHR
ncbi:unnamed protein product [Allacma fusca]|uniref:Zinc finger PHD-type domain-containing protein n=1 Tax=Allacma fusca TaxID=39272 RepID=A0A8J2NUP9_9HEXA|nr:unnamed protein product [Allacma fusca]